MRGSARAVVVGGGVGGTSIRLLARAARLGRRGALRARRAHQRLDVSLRQKLVGQLRGLAAPDAHDDALGRELYRTLGEEVGLEDPAGTRSGRCVSARSPERMGRS